MMKNNTIREFSTKEFDGKTLKEIRKEIDAYYHTNIQPKTIINKDTGKRIQFSQKGRKKTLHNIELYNAPVIKNLLQLLREAKLISVEPTKNEHPEVYRVFIFLITCKVDGIIKVFRVSVFERKNGYFQYSLYDNSHHKNGNL